MGASDMLETPRVRTRTPRVKRGAEQQNNMFGEDDDGSGPLPSVIIASGPNEHDLNDEVHVNDHDVNEPEFVSDHVSGHVDDLEHGHDTQVHTHHHKMDNPYGHEHDEMLGEHTMDPVVDHTTVVGEHTAQQQLMDHAQIANHAVLSENNADGNPSNKKRKLDE